MVEEKNTEVQETPETPKVPEVPQVTAGDLSLIVKIIDAGSERGAWKGEELSTIGTLRTKLVTIVQAVAPVNDTETGGDAVADAVVEEPVVEEPVVEEPVVEEKPKKK